MEEKKDNFHILELMVCPAFSVSGGVIEHVNRAAAQLSLCSGMAVQTLLPGQAEDYAAYSGGCLYLSLEVAGFSLGASVTRSGNSDIFVIDQTEQLELRTMALIAQDLRMPLADALNAVDRLLPQLEGSAEDEISQQLAQLNRRLTQINRVVLNMSDAARYHDNRTSRIVLEDAVSFIEEVLQKAGKLMDATGVQLSVKLPGTAANCLVDEEKLERAIYNLLSNAIKASRPGQTVEVELTQRQRRLYLSVTDHGEGMDDETMSNIFTRYRRSPGLDAAGNGVGLGMVIVRAAAAAHGGTVLVTRPESGGTKITLTMTLRTGLELPLHSSTLWPDYAGERDHGLLELSEVLPSNLYRHKN